MKPMRSLACVLALVVLSLSLAAVPAQAASASLSLSPAKGPAGTTVTVTGTGFPKKGSGTLSAGTVSAAFKVSASGYFTADVVIPQTSQPILDVQAASGTVKASAAFTVVATPVTDDDRRRRPSAARRCVSASAPRAARWRRRNWTRPRCSPARRRRSFCPTRTSTRARPSRSWTPPAAAAP